MVARGADFRVRSVGTAGTDGSVSKHTQQGPSWCGVNPRGGQAVSRGQDAKPQEGQEF